MSILRRIALLLIAALAVYIIYDIARLYSGQRGFENVPPEFSTGPQDADISVVEFLSYGCKYCREAHPTITEAVKKDAGVRYIPRPLPSTDAQAMDAARLAYAAGLQGKFIEMHNALIENYRVVNDAVVDDLAARTSTDAARLKTDMASPETEALLTENARLYKKIRTGATPTFIIGAELIYVPEGRMPTVQDFLNMFSEARGLQ